MNEIMDTGRSSPSLATTFLLPVCSLASSAQVMYS